MKIVIKTAITLLLAALTLFSIFGFLCTFEPMLPVIQWTWRLIYCAVALGSILGSTLLWKGRPSRHG
jgi:hypothetical protein